MSRFQFVADHRDTFEVKRLCQSVEVSRSAFYAWDRAAPARVERAAADAALAAQIKAAGVAVRGRHGPAAVQVDPGDELARLRARVFELEANERTLATERDILRAAAKYFAGETNW